jgi:hypothetical protein
MCSSCPVCRFVDLGCADAVAVGDLIADGVDWRTAHAMVSARPTAEWPGGRVVITNRPEVYEGSGIRTVAV